MQIYFDLSDAMTALQHDVPFFVNPLPGENGGVDFLGLRQVNLNLMDEFLPGVNNVTDSLRPYSVMCWIAFAFRNAASAAGIQNVSSEEFRKFREKIEIMFGWSHQLHDDGKGMVGNDQHSPQQTGIVSLDFESWNRKVSWFDAVNYGPSLKDENGLGFVRQVERGVYALTPAGDRLAASLDGVLKPVKGYAKLSDLRTIGAKVDIARELYAAWRCGRASSKEAEVFRSILYQSDAIATATRSGRRSAAIHLMLMILKLAKNGLTSAQLRQSMVCTQLPQNSDSAVVRAQAVWIILQIRQAQRLCFEALFCWIEEQMLINRMASSAQLTEALIHLLDESNVFTQDAQWLEHALNNYKRFGLEPRSLLKAAQKQSDADFFSKMEFIVENIPNDRNEAAVRAFELLILVAALTKNLDREGIFRDLLDEGNSRRVSLRYWEKFTDRYRRLNIKSFLIKFIDNFLLSQHFGVAAVRSTESKPRLRISIEETGLISLLESTEKIWQPRITPDRLVSTLSLMAESNLIKRKLRKDDGEAIYFC